MSLLGRDAPHRFLVQNYERGRDVRGNSTLVRVGDPVWVRGQGEPSRDWSSAEENLYNGLQIIDLLVVRARDWPGTVDSLVLFDGGIYETSGAPQHYGTGRRTQHWRVTLKWVRDAVPGEVP